MVVRGRGTPAGREERTVDRAPAHFVAFCGVSYRTMWARGGRTGGADRTAGGSGPERQRALTRADRAFAPRMAPRRAPSGRLQPNETSKDRSGFGTRKLGGTYAIPNAIGDRPFPFARRHGESGRTH